MMVVSRRCDLNKLVVDRLVHVDALDAAAALARVEAHAVGERGGGGADVGDVLGSASDDASDDAATRRSVRLRRSCEARCNP